MIMKIFSLFFLLGSFTTFAQGQIQTINPEKKQKEGPEAPVCRSPRFRMISDCSDICYYDEDQDAVFHQKSGKPFTGTCKTCHYNGNLEMYLTFENGKPFGKDTIYYLNGQINLIRSHDEMGYGKEDGEWLFYRENGSLKWEKKYMMGNAHGEHRYYFEDSTIQKIENWQDNKLHGKKQEFYPNHNIKKEINYKNGEWDGAYRTYYEDGKIESEQIYSNGKKEGSSTYYFPDGTIFYTENHENGCREGTAKRFYDNGRRWTVENYSKDLRNGEFEEFYDNETNSLKYTAVYKNGVLLEEHYYDEFGEETAAPENKNPFMTKEDADDAKKWPEEPTDEFLQENNITRKEYDKARERYFKNKAKQKASQAKTTKC